MIERYARPQMSRIWSEESRIKMLFRVEAVFLEVLAKDKAIPTAQLKSFEGLFRKSLLAAAKSREEKSGHEVVGLIAAVAGELKTRAPLVNRYLHYGLTSSDVLDTALAIQLRDSADLLIQGWLEVAARIKSLARKHERTWMAGRTHGVHAEPVTLGVKFAGWHAEALRNLDRMRRARELISYGKISGAVGAFTHFGPEYEARVCEKLALSPEPVSTQVVPRDRHAEFFHALVLSAAAIERFALEIRHLQKTEVLELEEPFSEDQKGSSAMPHKRNPVLCENLCGLSRMIRSYEHAVIENIPLWHERDISHSSVERVFFPDGVILLDFMLARFGRVLDGLTVDAAAMRRNLDASHGLVFSQKVLLRLIDSGLGRLEAYELVQKNAMRCWRTKEPFLNILLSDSAVTKRLSREDLASCFDTASYEKPIREILKRGGVY